MLAKIVHLSKYPPLGNDFVEHEYILGDLSDFSEEDIKRILLQAYAEQHGQMIYKSVKYYIDDLEIFELNLESIEYEEIRQ